MQSWEAIPKLCNSPPRTQQLGGNYGVGFSKLAPGLQKRLSKSNDDQPKALVCLGLSVEVGQGQGQACLVMPQSGMTGHGKHEMPCPLSLPLHTCHTYQEPLLTGFTYFIDSSQQQ